MSKILLLGDLVVDCSYYGKIKCIAPEGAFPVINDIKTVYSLGCCGNVLMNLCNFYEKIYFITCINDKDLDIIKKILINYKNIEHINFHQEDRNIIIKNRLYAENKCMSRFDFEKVQNLNESNEQEIYNFISHIIYDINLIILSDYEKGFLTYTLTRKILDLSNRSNVISLVDPKTNDFSKYKNATFVKPNKNELRACLKFEKGNICEKDYYNNNTLNLIENEIMKKYNIKFILNTLSEQGVQIIYYNDDKIIQKIKPCNKCEVIDVVGCGDTILSALAIYLSKENYKINNIDHFLTLLCDFGEKSVTTKGCYNITKEDWNKYFISNNTVFTNGCFDIFHVGHLKLLKYCRSIGKKVIIGINTDESIKRLKGIDRPINSLNNRIAFLKELNLADEIIPFEEDTPLNLLKAIKPDILVKGGDYTIDSIIGKEYVKDIIIFPTEYGYSSSNIISIIKSK